MTVPLPVEAWDAWHERAEPKYPHEKVVQYCFRNFPPESRQGVRALDLGCGSGVHTVFLAGEGFEVTGTDLSPVGIENTRRKLDALGLDAELRVEAADAPDLPPDSFDLILCIGVFDSAGPIVARDSLQRLPALLREGGRGLFLLASDRDFRVSRREFTLHGYSRDEVEELFNGRFSQVWLDRYITTYHGGQAEQNDWLVTVRK